MRQAPTLALILCIIAALLGPTPAGAQTPVVPVPSRKPTPKRPKAPTRKTKPKPPPRDEVTAAPSPYGVPVRESEPAAPEAVPAPVNEAPVPPETVTPVQERTASATPDVPGEEEEALPSLGPVSGKVFAYARTPFRRPYEQLSASLWLELKPRFTEATYAKVSVSGDVLTSTLVDEHVRGRVREGYLGLRAHGWDIRLGQQMIPWGGADIFNPTDLLTARDLAFFSTDPEASRIGAVSALVSYQPEGSGLQLTLVGTPFFPETRVLVPRSRIPAGAVLADPKRPSWRLDRIELAAKIKYGGEGWDLALIGFQGFDHVPHFEPGAYDDARGFIVERRYHRQSAIGIDGSVGLGSWIARTEAAVVITGNPSQNDRFAPPSHAIGVIGLERPFLERFRAMAQLVGRIHYPAYDPPPGLVPPPNDPTALQRLVIERAIDEANKLLFNWQDILRFATTLRVSYDSEDEKVQAEVAGVVNLVGHDFAVRSMVGYRFIDALLVHAGYEVFAGPKWRPFGSIRHLSGAFVQATYTF